ncbi:NADP-specific glutamate dehydrogenase [Alloalcanivorax gelatiniphagus]|uniref:Glutamate dehydrogenase n=1 Tax=Alloalcanivorax gelatiniphagus TaxID=1194167 RepID=A0ABY2XJ48_9GAMM|nr:NADP-specific glutamate dehydrogenase [Alloalcanivorax gelatiniphagus]TMW11483.1 NADP-specific glutamate dehydrogenase [Alloalcanivorax gelatiniphagus]
METKTLLKRIKERDPHHEYFQQAAGSLLKSISRPLRNYPDLNDSALMERLLEPERVITFRVPWIDDQGRAHVNRGFRVQMNGALGPYKGGLRFHPSVNLDVLSFLALEQTVKNALTGLPLGGGKGGSDFDPKGRSDDEIMLFCQAFMAEFHHHMGADTDVPAGDMGVGPREIGYLFGMYRKLGRRHDGGFTGKQLAFGGSLMRVEATGYGVIYFLEHMLANQGEKLDGKTVAISGAGNVARHALAKALDSGARVVTLSDSQGFVEVSKGLTAKHLEAVAEIKNGGGRLGELADRFSGVRYHKGKRPWGVRCDIALPCATQNELGEKDADALVDNGCQWLVEGANMPCSAAAVKRLRDGGVVFGPGKAANAGGVAVSGLEMSQNSRRESWSAGEVDQRLREIMERIHRRCVDHGGQRKTDYLVGADLAGYLRVAEAMAGQGVL